MRSFVLTVSITMLTPNHKHYDKLPPADPSTIMQYHNTVQHHSELLKSEPKLSAAPSYTLFMAPTESDSSATGQRETVEQCQLLENKP